MGAPRRKSKAAVRMERERRRGAKDAEAWRERGKLFRAKIMMKDEESGGDVFTLSNQCEIEKYYDVAERVSAVNDVVSSVSFLDGIQKTRNMLVPSLPPGFLLTHPGHVLFVHAGIGTVS